MLQVITAQNNYCVTMLSIMDDIPYSRIHVIYVLRLCAVGFALCNVHDIF